MYFAVSVVQCACANTAPKKMEREDSSFSSLRMASRGENDDKDVAEEQDDEEEWKEEEEEDGDDDEEEKGALFVISTSFIVHSVDFTLLILPLSLSLSRSLFLFFSKSSLQGSCTKEEISMASIRYHCSHTGLFSNGTLGASL